MRDINRAERLLALFTSPDSAVGIVGDLSEERPQHGSFWFWRQVLGTVLSLCRGALWESPVIVVLLVSLGFALSVAVSSAAEAAVTYLFHLYSVTNVWWMFFIIKWAGKLIAGAMMVAVAPRLGMAACVFLGGIELMLSVVFIPLSYLVAVFSGPFRDTTFWWLNSHLSLATPVVLLLGGAMISRRWNARTLRSAK